MAKLSMYSGELNELCRISYNLIFFKLFHSACQKCRCTGWKTQEENRHRDVESNYCPKFTEECRNPGCKHPLGEFWLTRKCSFRLMVIHYTFGFSSVENHISHLTDITDVQLNELLGAIVDIENLFISMHREVDEETRKVYNYLFHVSRKKKFSNDPKI